MSCEHEVRFTIKPTDDACRFHFDVRAYKDRIVAPDEYSGATVVTPSDQTQTLQTKDKLVKDDITIFPAPTEYLSTDHNGTFLPSDGKVGFSEVDVNVVPDLRPLSVSENGSYEPDGFDGYSAVNVNVPAPAPVTESLSVTDNGTYVPSAGVDGFDEVVVDVPTGDFPSYDDVVLPSEYQRVEYIGSSGTQFIDLPFGFYPTDTISMRSSIDRSMSEDKFMVCPSQWNNNNNRFGLCGIGGSKSFIFAYGSLKTSQTAYAFSRANENDGDLHDFCYKDGVFRIVDLKRASGIGGMTFGAESYILRLFYGYNSNTSGKIAYFVHEKADGRKIALFACYRKSDGVIGMYDIENDVFYTNDGSGDFTKGADI